LPLNAKGKSRPISSGTLSSRSRKRRNSSKLESSSVQFLYDRYVGKNPERIKAYHHEILNAAIARQIFELRTKSGLSQRELAARVGTSASAICRLEDADYDGHSLSLLKRIAQALGTQVEIQFVSVSAVRIPARRVAARKKTK
jgi:ribosome-binding protein aMBF1 (putative translation factor)